MFWFKKKAKQQAAPKSTIRLKVAPHTVDGRNIIIVWVQEVLTGDPNEARATLQQLQKYFPKRPVVLLTRDLTSDGFGPVFIGPSNIVNHLSEFGFYDFKWQIIDVHAK